MSNAASLPLQRLSPAARADLIYRAARQGEELALWRAALGTGGRRDLSPPPSAGNGLLDFQSLLEALQPGEAKSPPGPADDQALSLGANQPLEPVIMGAAARTNLPPAALAAIVDAESARTASGAWKADAHNPRSSATGIGQFLAKTWLSEAERAGTALHQTAVARGWIGGDGKVLASAREQLLALRHDPAVSIDAVADYARANLDTLARRGLSLGTSVTQIARSAWLAHHLGAGDAQRFLTGGLSDTRAGTLLAAQVGVASASRRIAATGDAGSAHRQWLLSYLDRHLTPAKFTL